MKVLLSVQLRTSGAFNMKNKRGFILLLTFAFMVVLTLVVGGLMYMVSTSTKDVGVVAEDYRLLSLADAGIQRPQRALKDRTIVIGAADLKGATTSGTASNVSRISYVDNSYATVASKTAILKGFDANYANVNITAVSIVARAGRQTGGSGATLEVSYSIGGVTGTTKLTQILPSSTTLVEYSKSITLDRTWTPSTILDAANNFTLTATRTAGNRNIYLDAIYLEVIYQVASLNEDWANGTYATFPITLGDGSIKSVSITDEQGKVHINTASQALLWYLFQNLGIASATANTLATNIVSYRITKPFDSVEELQRVAGMTTANYVLMHDYVTVYSFINPYVQRAAGARAPININTASFVVLKAVFDPLGLGAGDSTSLANAIISSRATIPFSSFYMFGSTNDFYSFVMAQSYLSSSGSPDERDKVLDNADASLLIPVPGSSTYPAATTEFCYDTSVFEVNSLVDLNGRNLRVKTIVGSDGSRTFTTYSGDSTLVGYRKENFE